MIPRMRILIRKELLIELAELHHKGVPITKLIANYKLGISHPILNKLIRIYWVYKHNHNAKTRKETGETLFPPWLNTKDDIQQPPENYKYIGLFPFGYWEDSLTEKTINENDSTFYRSGDLHSTVKRRFS